jgi:glycerol kinase
MLRCTNELQSDKKFVGAIDNGTTSSRFLIFDSNGEPVAQHQIEFKQIYPHSGYAQSALCRTQH